jgi:subtilisin family serine protease
MSGRLPDSGEPAAARTEGGAAVSYYEPEPGSDSFVDGTTGRYLVLFAEDTTKAGVKALGEAMGLSVATVSAEGKELEAEEAVLFDKLGVAVVNAPPEQIEEAGVSTLESGAIIAVEPERIVHAIEATPFARAPAQVGNGALAPPAQLPPAPLAAPAGVRSAEYLQGYRDAVLHLTTPPEALAAEASLAPAAVVDESQATWGLQVVKAVNSCRTGRGIRLAVLDTGFDLGHADFAGRTIRSQSFVPAQEVQDLHGHGTHCIGTAMGPKCPRGVVPRYGVAHRAEVYAGKVLSNAGSGSDSQILAGINWAVANKCAVISMSLGARAQVGQSFSQVFEAVALRASEAGALIVAAAGNDSRRPLVISPVSHPANCPSIVAVAALDSSTAIASFSNRGINPIGGQVDVAGPGVDVFSSWPMPTRYRRLNGTSMATPHAAGVAALLAEANPAVRGAALGRLLTATALRLASLPSADVGAGIVQAP